MWAGCALHALCYRHNRLQSFGKPHAQTRSTEMTSSLSHSENGHFRRYFVVTRTVDVCPRAAGGFPCCRVPEPPHLPAVHFEFEERKCKNTSFLARTLAQTNTHLTQNKEFTAKQFHKCSTRVTVTISHSLAVCWPDFCEQPRGPHVTLNFETAKCSIFHRMTSAKVRTTFVQTPLLLGHAHAAIVCLGRSDTDTV